MPFDSLASDLIEIIPRFLVLIRQNIKAYSTSNLTMPQLRILSQLKFEALSNSDLAERCGVDITSMSRMASHLIHRGYIIRSINSKDKRRVCLTMSAKGRREQEAIASSVQTWIASHIMDLSPTEQAQLCQGLKILQKLETRMLRGKSMLSLLHEKQ